jgi:serine-type D-Ala-D-Ala carboxypeptidase/endopeptidase (penicillin-binding protein 4)
MSVRRTAAALVAAALLSSCGPHAPAPHAASRPTPIVAAPHAPAWSVRDVAALQAQLRGALGASALATGGLAVLDAQGRSLFVRRERTPLAPASTFKLVVGATALETLGPDYRFATTFETLAAPVDGTLRGDLYLVGSGDPTLTRDDLRAGAGALARSGVRTIQGDVVADASVFAGREVNPAWEADDLQYGYAAGTSALALDGGTVEFHIVPTVVGGPARIIALPASTEVRVAGGIVTSYATMLQIQRDPLRNNFTFEGRVAAGAEQSFWRPLTGLPQYAADVAHVMLRQRGITVHGGVQTGIAPTAPFVLWRHRSAPLRDIVPEMMLTSNNHYAEQLLRAVGATRGGGTVAGGAALERAVMMRGGVPQGGLRIVDASGLAPTDRIAPLTLAMLLARTAVEPVGPVFVRSLPRVGIEGTVRWHHLTDALGRARAKSGHIENVNALAGYVETRRHGRVAFAFILNDRRADDGPVYAGIDRALDILARS